MNLLPSRIERSLAAPFAVCGLLIATSLPSHAQAQEVAPAEDVAPAPAQALPTAVVPPALPPPSFSPAPLQVPLGVLPALGVKGSVIGVHDLQATISVGARQGITPGARILFVAQPTRPDEPFDKHAPDQVIGEVVNVTEDAALVALGMLESVSVGQSVEVTALRPSARRIAPLRPPAMLILEGGLRPFLPIRRVSVGAFADLAVTYLPSIPMFVRAELLPAGGRVGAGADMGALGGLLSVGYDHRYVGIGLGVGVLLHRDFVEVPGDIDGAMRLGAVRPRLQFAQLLRAGARDGLHLSVKTAFALASERWRLASVTVAGQVPVATKVALNPRIMVGPGAGIFLAELGVRLLVRGDGGHGSLFVRPVAGVAGTFDGDNNGWDEYQGDISGAVDQMLFGPMVGLDLEFRL
jgi:hypothetical protein